MYKHRIQLRQEAAAAPEPLGKGCWGGGSRWSFSEQLRPVSRVRAQKMSLSPGKFPKGLYVNSLANDLSTLVFGMSQRSQGLGQGPSREKSEIPQKNEAKQSFSQKTAVMGTLSNTTFAHRPPFSAVHEIDTGLIRVLRLTCPHILLKYTCKNQETEFLSLKIYIIRAELKPVIY